jgi:hypothetical protein
MGLPEPAAPGALPIRAAAGLLLMPVVVGLAAIVLRRVHVSEASADLVVFGGAASSSIAALAIAATSHPAWRWRFAVTAAAAVTLGMFAWLGVTSTAAAVAADAALVAAAWGTGSSIGRRIEHPGHLLPACVVVACADAASIVSRFGPTHALAESERALSVVAVTFPVPGTSSFAPALGIGDLVFIALVLGALRAHGLSVARGALVCWVGTLVAGLASAVLTTAVPALVPIAAAVVSGIPQARSLRSQDRRASIVAMAVAVAFAAAAVISQLLHPVSAGAAP